MAYVEIYRKNEQPADRPARVCIVGAVNGYECVIDVATAPDGYAGARRRAELTVEDHNRQFPDDPWTVEEEADERVVEVALAETKAAR